MIIYDEYGYPVELFYNRPITNFIRKILHGNIKQTIKRFNREKYTKACCELYSEGKINSQTLHVITEKIEKVK